jgi:hypothetical protein
MLVWRVDTIVRNGGNTGVTSELGGQIVFSLRRKSVTTAFMASLRAAERLT